MPIISHLPSPVIVSGQAYPSSAYVMVPPLLPCITPGTRARLANLLVDTLSSGGYNALVLDTSGNPNIRQHHSEALWYAAGLAPAATWPARLISMRAIDMALARRHIYPW